MRRDTNEPVDTADVTRMAQASDGTWVTLDDHEIASVAGPSGGCEVIEFVPVDKADRYLTDALYQLRPKADKRGGAATAAAYGLLLAGMAARKVHALVRVTMRKGALLRPAHRGGDLLTIATSDAVRQRRDLLSAQPGKAELDMVCQLIDAIGVGAPVLVDDVSVKVHSTSMTRHRPVVSSRPERRPAPSPAPVDLARRCCKPASTRPRLRGSRARWLCKRIGKVA